MLLVDLQDGPGDTLVDELGDSAIYHHTNVSREADVAGAIAAAVGAWGSLDVLYNNAGFVGATGSFEYTPVEEYDLTMDVLLKSVFFGIKHAAPIMKAQRSGSIVSTSSVSGLMPGVGTHLPVQRRQSRRDHDDPLARARACGVEHPRELRVPRLRGHRAGRGWQPHEARTPTPPHDGSTLRASS